MNHAKCQSVPIAECWMLLLCVLENGSPVLLVVCDTDIVYSGALIFILFMTKLLINSMEVI